MSLTINGPLLEQAAVCEPILRALPDWFGIEEALVQYVKDIDVMPTFTATLRGTVAGFATINRHNAYSAEIHVIGVRSPSHRKGIGRALVERAEAWLREDRCEYLQVKTLGPARPDEHYDRTRKFYEAMGFRPLEESRTIWGERLPCLIMVKFLLGSDGATEQRSDSGL